MTVENREHQMGNSLRLYMRRISGYPFDLSFRALVGSGPMPSLAAHLHCTKLLLFVAMSNNPVGKGVEEIHRRFSISAFCEAALPKICLLGATALKR